MTISSMRIFLLHVLPLILSNMDLFSDNFGEEFIPMVSVSRGIFYSHTLDNVPCPLETLVYHGNTTKILPD